MLNYAKLQQRRNGQWLCGLALLLLIALFISLCAGDQWIGPANWLMPVGNFLSGKYVYPVR
jgi:vitamin B12 transport system permease protein